MSKHIVIVGGGVIGLCAAYYAQRFGHQVTLLERGAASHDSCSLGNAGMITPSHFTPLAAPGMVAMGLRMMFNPESPFYIRPRLDRDLMDWGWKFYRAATAAHVARSAPLLRDLNLSSRACYEELAAESGNEFGLVKRGMLMLCATEERLQEEAELVEAAHKLGLDAEILTPQQTAQRDPGIRMTIAGATHFTQDCHLSPQKFLAGLTENILTNGGQILWETEVRGWKTAGARIAAAVTDRGEIEADEFVLAGGAWTMETARNLGLNLPMQAGKGYSLTLNQPKQAPTICSILTEARVAVTPMGDTLRFAGTMEIAGMRQGTNPARVNGILKSIPRYFPDFHPDDFRDSLAWNGLRPCSPDGLPYIGRSARYTNLAIGTGHAMMGLSLGPITGKLLAEVLSDAPLSLPLDLLSPDRYMKKNSF